MLQSVRMFVVSYDHIIAVMVMMMSANPPAEMPKTVDTESGADLTVVAVHVAVVG